MSLCSHMVTQLWQLMWKPNKQLHWIFIRNLISFLHLAIIHRVNLPGSRSSPDTVWLASVLSILILESGFFFAQILQTVDLMMHRSILHSWDLSGFSTFTVMRQLAFRKITKVMNKDNFQKKLMRNRWLWSKFRRDFDLWGSKDQVQRLLWL